MNSKIFCVVKWFSYYVLNWTCKLFEGLINFIVNLYYSFASFYRCRMGVITVHKFCSLKQVFVGPNYKPFNSNFSMSYKISTSRRGNYFRFDSVFIKKKITKPNLKKNETGSNRPVSVRFGFLEEKLVQTSLARFWLGLAFFSGLS